MKNKVLKITFLLGIIFLFTGLSVIMVNAQIIKSKNISLKDQFKATEDPDMLIFLSPRYKQDTAIITAINGYISVIKEEIDWDAKIIRITEKDNNYQIIDGIIEEHYQTYSIKACLMVGEDLDTPLAGDSDYLEKPSIVPWFTTGGTETYEITEQGIISKSYQMDICISLLYPTHELDYLSKKNQIINAFEKFSTQRDHKLTHDISVFESKDLNTNSKEIYQQIDEKTHLNYMENPGQEDINQITRNTHSMLFIHGHSNPSGTYINGDQRIWFSAEQLDLIETPFFGADGCYVSGWWSNQKDNDHLDTSISASCYGSKIFSSKHINVMALGLLSQNGYANSISFIENVIPKIIDGENLAESMIGSNFTGDFIIVGDPTFHFNQ